MSRVAYVNGRYVPHREASVHVEDRGYQFADGLYEVVAVRGGLPVDFALHYDRLCTGLAALQIANPLQRAAWIVVLRQMIQRNRVRDGILYLQVTRGVSPRNHLFPHGVMPSVVITARPGSGPSAESISVGVSAVSVADIRWRRRDIKSVSLLPNILAKQQAAEQGAYEALLVAPDGTVTEAGSSNAWMVNASGEILTHPVGHDILPGVTRMVLIRLARAAGYTVVERSFTLEEAKVAREVFVSSTIAYVMPIVSVDGVKIGEGVPGPLALALRTLYVGHVAGITPAVAWS
ncbi:D-amino-acid transaminase [Insolitispirillum peregrinum]|uniref:Probable branched-chain-amino-acid aminotransferase n=1 Tax=Insolitispirillum peregrinum TaxID=80876 RepID=A0A1N7IYA9_9PROT|nr:D-amino-acid transaminase [Insolitispirillum peregrinum]SIS42102.1 D-alanine transaminase [Insolitispirillum peregrinum]